MIVTDLVLAVRQTDDGGVEARAVSGHDGPPRCRGDGVALAATTGRRATAASRDGQRPGGTGSPRSSRRPSGTASRTSSSRGAATTSRSTRIPLDSGARRKPGETTSALVYTDRSIYRPLQKVLWKAVVYRGRARSRRASASRPRRPVTVTLVDANGQAVESKTVTTNAYGSAAGEFAIPAGRALGAWSVRLATGAAPPSIRVEEYKRPTFEATLEESEGRRCG